ncbi:Ilt1p KNAG_0H02960 [Huiozyma naganishii CBS 8797]|uniref:PQ-loop repeat-containing protein n=1 Tax=Huiozyma naganishii (strain ATCC MYA-139 / BCRC 22969 / CBS 8797 / KCTC 17520 / NBRC 10181 / NCYC 3082 / Yp74L-3) TaxID=1071383 RepID=J7S9U2_HUIN7|nr:hypothetical protein KNAG_0H02960 [Kazachstania naganishii CBS 8797]CCK71711.1 hypothetical protein KNAG_0H02960 [Kazachstania naganishii CBS 8797]
MVSEGASTALGTVATICWCVQLIPQIISNWRKKDCTGLPPLMMFLWVVSGIPFAIYFCISAPNVILQVQPHLFMVFCAVSFAQTCYYPPCKMTRWKIVAIMLGIVLTDIGMEVGFILWLRPLYEKGTTWPDLIFGILASALLGIGLLPPYFELIKRKGRVVGINFMFLFIDSLGAWLSIASVIVGTMDVMGIILYSIIAGMEIGIFLSHFIWCCRFKWFTKEKFVDSDENISELRETGDESFTNIDKESGFTNEHYETIHSTLKGASYYRDKTRELHPDEDDEEDFYYENGPREYELEDVKDFNRNTCNVHAIHGIILQRGPSEVGTSGSIKI